ncbi:acyltransferase family protein [Geodermatophilus sp. SYSU D00698]
MASDTAVRGRWTLDPRDNSLNLIRLGLALTVLLSHSLPISGRTEPLWAGKTPGSWAVVGFFALSGYLITGSRLRSDGARFFINRVARIMPGYLVCLTVIAFVFAPIAYVVQNGTINGFLTSPNTPVNFVFGNALLKIWDYTVAGTLADVPYPHVWNGSLWSLYFEFLCYVLIGIGAIVPVVRRRPWPIIAMFVVSVLAKAQMATLSSYTGGNWDFAMLVDLLPYFLGGAVVFVVKDRCLLRWYLALPASGLAILVVMWQTAWGAQLVAPLFAYSLLWLASALPSPQLVKTHDVSYGVYVYSWPSTQLLVLFGADHGWVPLVLQVMTLTLILAVLSWLLVERPAKDLVTRRPSTPHQATLPAVPTPRSVGRSTAVTTEPALPAVPVMAPVSSGTQEQPVPRNVPAAI